MSDLFDSFVSAASEFIQSFGGARAVLLFIVLGMIGIALHNRRLKSLNKIFLSTNSDVVDPSLRKAAEKVVEAKRMADERRFFVNLKYGVTALVGIVFVTYLVFFLLRFPVSNSPAEWGQMGDFFGGMLNPILAFASFIALLYTIRIQSEELRLTRQEFEKSVEAQKLLVHEAKIQSDISKVQLIRSLASSVYNDAKKLFEDRNVMSGFSDYIRVFKPTIISYGSHENMSGISLSKSDQMVLDLLISFIDSIDGLSNELLVKDRFVSRNPDSIVTLQQSESLRIILQAVPIGNLVKIFAFFGLPGREQHPTVSLFVKYGVGFEIAKLIERVHSESYVNFKEDCDLLYRQLWPFKRHMLFKTTPFNANS